MTITIKFENDDNVAKALATVFDLALKQGGYSVLSIVNIVQSAMREIPQVPVETPSEQITEEK